MSLEERTAAAYQAPGGVSTVYVSGGKATVRDVTYDAATGQKTVTEIRDGVTTTRTIDSVPSQSNPLVTGILDPMQRLQSAIPDWVILLLLAAAVVVLILFLAVM